jgi:hypothetical protein
MAGAATTGRATPAANPDFRKFRLVFVIFDLP